MKLYLADVMAHPNYVGITHTHHTVKNEGGLCKYVSNNEWRKALVLESFYYSRSNPYFSVLAQKGADIMLDSGAFSVMENGVRVRDWDAYIEQYAEFINHYKIEKFIELDIESVVGMKEVERLRARLESLTGKQCMPVWHRWRGLDYFKSMCNEYPYVCFGGLMSDGVSRQQLEKVFPWFIKEAHARGAKIHGLGYSPLDIAKKPFKFDSVDSSTWVSGNRFGHVYLFNQKTGTMSKFDKKRGQRVKHIESAVHNLHEWLKFQQYLLTIKN